MSDSVSNRSEYNKSMRNKRLAYKREFNKLMAGKKIISVKSFFELFLMNFDF
jgi:hypothetical protein